MVLALKTCVKWLPDGLDPKLLTKIWDWDDVRFRHRLVEEHVGSGRYSFETKNASLFILTCAGVHATPSLDSKWDTNRAGPGMRDLVLSIAG